uniref:NADH dehydrogenase subunit 4 n=1 Tax=Riptortus pedestris TaxID=329032 RepID=R4WDA2_RIPPE|nr:unknown secreted protein [Riptortus pedestris]
MQSFYSIIFLAFLIAFARPEIKGMSFSLFFFLPNLYFFFKIQLYIKNTKII